MPDKLKVVSLFSGCGGLDLGLSSAGFEVVLAIDIWQVALDTYKLNHPQSEIICKSVADFTQEEILELKNKLPKVDIVCGGPPCQGFSLAGKRDAFDPRNQLWKDYFRFIEVFEPDYFVMENVFGITSMVDEKGNKILDQLVEKIQDLDYKFTLNKVNTKDYGIPQERKRLIIIGSKNNEINLVPNKKIVTVRDVIGDLESLKSGQKSKNDDLHFGWNHAQRHLDWLKPVPEGESAHKYKHLTGMEIKGFETTYKRIWWDKYSPAITTCFNSISSQNNVHPKDTRALSIREAMRIQTFPDSFKFAGSHKDICKQIGNAVPPKLGQIIGETILKNVETKNNLFH